MKSTIHLLFAALGLVATVSQAATSAPVSPTLATEIATEAYVWGYPLVMMDATRRYMTNYAKPTGIPGQVPPNQFTHGRAFLPLSFRAVVRPNFDTLYSSAWLDLSKEPMVLTLPKTERYHVIPMHDAYSNVFAALGTRMTGGTGGHYLVAGPSWHGKIPSDMTLIQSPTNDVWIIGRTQTNGPGDFAYVNGLQDQMGLQPLSSWGKPYTPPAAAVDPTINMKLSPVPTVIGMDAKTFFTRMMEGLIKNPPSVHDQGVVTRMARIGLVVGKPLNFSALSPEMQQALQSGAAAGLAEIRQSAKAIGAPHNGWYYTTGAIGYFGGDYLLRAATALDGIGYNRPEDAVYPLSSVDSTGAPLNGANRYAITFDKGQTPPVGAFWSLTVYDAEGFPVDNMLHRYAIGDRDALKFDADGKLTLYLQHDSPGEDKVSNWLPVPDAPFKLQMRLYSPSPSVASGTWEPPAISRLR